MRFPAFLGLSAATMGLLGGSLAGPILPTRRNYRTVMPVATKNIGRNLLKTGAGKYMPHQGEREIARRKRQVAAGQLRFITHGPRT